MDEHDENSVLSPIATSGRFQSPTRVLSEMSPTHKNSRAPPPSMLPPPGTVGFKHKSSAIPEPAPKRVTLAKRAGENPRPVSQQSFAFSTSAIQGTSLVNARNTFSSSVSSRSTSKGSTNGRPASAASTRQPHHTRQQSRPKMPPPSGRPASAMAGNVPNGGNSSLGKRKVWDTEGRLDSMEALYNELKGKVKGMDHERDNLVETVGVYKDRISELEIMKSQLSAENTSLTKRLAEADERVRAIHNTANDEREEFQRDLRQYLIQMEDVERQHRREVEDQDRQRRDMVDKSRRDANEELEAAKREAQETLEKLLRKHQDELRDLEKRMQNQVDDERAQRHREVQQMSADLSLERQKAGADLGTKDQELKNAKDETIRAQAATETKELLIKNIRAELAETSAKLTTVESTCRAQKARIDFLESDSSQQAQSFADAEQRMQDAIQMAEECRQKLRKEETMRRMLHNQVQELKGNIRVFCRVRPTLTSETESSAKIEFPDGELDSKEIQVLGQEEKSSLGTVTTKKHGFAFDKVFSPSSQNEEIFEEISQLVQSALDGYNVCIFCYGQTGAGKTHTMLASDGMIPRAVNQIYESTLALEEKGWKYALEGNFVEVYNENLNDLLGKANELDKKKHEIHNDQQKRVTTITGITTESLDSPGKVEVVLQRASANRSVAATKANERSSRSHSVFILKLKGENKATGESSEGTLNLVDLAGSERLSQSQATGDRLKETQSINKSLSALGDVISSLGQSKASAHIPYRNSKLTELLQFSLGGNSKTLMFVMVSPLQAHLNETLTSLKFATRVHNTHIGTAKKQSKVKE